MKTKTRYANRVFEKYKIRDLEILRKFESKKNGEKE